MKIKLKSLILALLLVTGLAANSFCAQPTQYKANLGDARWNTKLNAGLDALWDGAAANYAAVTASIASNVAALSATITANYNALAGQISSVTTIINNWAIEDNIVTMVTAAPTYSSGTAFTLPGDYTSRFPASAVMQAQVAAGLVHSTVASSSFGGGVTTVNLNSSVLTSPITRVYVVATRDGLWPNGPGYVVAADYGTNQAALAAADTVAAAAGKQLVIGRAYSITGDLTLAASVKIMPSATLTIATTKTLTINGPLDAAFHQIFSCTGTGKVVFGTANGTGYGVPGRVRELNPIWWGAVGNGIADDIIPLQAMVDCSVDSGDLPMFVPGGHYKITDTWKLNKGVHYSGFKLRGQGGEFYDPSATMIDARSFGDRPAVNIQGARMMEVSSLCIQGGNLAPITNAQTWQSVSAGGFLEPVLANWITPGCVDSRYGPYAGLSFDAYYGPATTGSYPNDPYDRTVSSAWVTIKDVTIFGFVTGTVLSPWNRGDQDTAGISFYDCNIMYNTYGYSCGSSQARSIEFYNTNVSANWVCFATLRHGSQNGNIPSMFGGILQVAYKLFETGSANGNNPRVFNGVHCESFAWFGEFGRTGAGGAYATSFVGCNFWLATSGAHRPPFQLVAHSKVKFDSCTFVAAIDDPFHAFNIASSKEGPVVFDNCQLRDFAVVPEVFIGLGDPYAYNLVTFTNTRVERYGGALDSLTTAVDRTLYYDNNGVGRQYIGLGVSMVFMDGLPYKVSKPGFYGLNTPGWVQACSTTDAVVSGTTHTSTLTFTADSVASLRVGDILPGRVTTPLGDDTYNMVPVFKITNITGVVVTAVSMFDGIDATYAPTAIYVYVPFFINTTEATGATHSNTTVDNVTNVGNFLIGDFIQGAGIPSGTRIANIVGTTITLSKAATATAAGVALYNCRLTAM